MSKTKSINVLYETLSIENKFLKELGLPTVSDRSALFRGDMFKNIIAENSEREGKLMDKGSSASFGQCKKCKSKNNSLIPIQTRSADEPVDFFVVCNVCGTRWHAD